ncbi:MAG: glutaminase [Bacteroidales bacterium]|jgi:glutaminase|nr:glutaminase [Bacteroidales bacterium]
MDYSSILEQVFKESKAYSSVGKIANYIPELSNINPDKFGLYIQTKDNQHFELGDSLEPFSIQSISKVFTLSMAFSLLGENIWKRVGVEPSGSPFNSIVQLEYENGIPRNPFINPGALVITDILLTHLNNPKTDLLLFVRKLAQDDSINFDLNIAQSEKETGHHNASLVHMLKAHGNINNPCEEVLDFYYHQCSIVMNCKQLAQSFSPYASLIEPFDFASVELNKSQVKRINAIMLSSGFYDESGEFAFKVGLPGKSGVGGGIIAFLPHEYSIAVWSPKLNKKGNSVRGMKALELFTTLSGQSIF